MNDLDAFLDKDTPIPKGRASLSSPMAIILNRFLIMVGSLFEIEVKFLSQSSERLLIRALIYFACLFLII